MLHFTLGFAVPARMAGSQRGLAQQLSALVASVKDLAMGRIHRFKTKNKKNPNLNRPTSTFIYPVQSWWLHQHPMGTNEVESGFRVPGVCVCVLLFKDTEVPDVSVAA